MPQRLLFFGLWAIAVDSGGAHPSSVERGELASAYLEALYPLHGSSTNRPATCE